MNSPIGLEAKGSDFTQNIVLSDYGELSVDGTWKTINSKNPKVRDKYIKYSFKVNQENKYYQIIMHLCDLGFAYRYVFSEGFAKIT